MAKERIKKEEKVSVKEPKKASLALRILVEPWITEKSHQLMSLNKYVFKVSRDSTKETVGKSIEEYYGVKVEGVNIVNIQPKKRSYGRVRGTKSGYKKAIVKLKEGDKIELFEGA